MATAMRQGAALAAGERTLRLRLTLGALAAMEAGLGVASLAEMEARLAAPTARDFAVILAALIEGGGEAMTPEEVVRLPIDVAEAAAAVTGAFAAAGLGAS